jgi:hypothetical protein
MSGISMKGDTISTTLMSNKFTLFIIVLLMFCSFMGFLCFSIIIDGGYPHMPRSFFAGIGGAGVIFVLHFLYTVLNHRTRVLVNMEKRAFIEYRRLFGRQEKRSYPLSDTLKISKVVTQKYMNTAHNVGYKHRSIYDINLLNGGNEIPIYVGFDPDMADSIMEFFSKYNIPVVTPTPTLNKWVVFLTVLFMGVLLYELHTMGLLND